MVYIDCEEDYLQKFFKREKIAKREKFTKREKFAKTIKVYEYSKHENTSSKITLENPTILIIDTINKVICNLSVLIKQNGKIIPKKLVINAIQPLTILNDIILNGISNIFKMKSTNIKTEIITDINYKLQKYIDSISTKNLQKKEIIEKKRENIEKKRFQRSVQKFSNPNFCSYRTNTQKTQTNTEFLEKFHSNKTIMINWCYCDKSIVDIFGYYYKCCCMPFIELTNYPLNEYENFGWMYSYKYFIIHIIDTINNFDISIIEDLDEQLFNLLNITYTDDSYYQVEDATYIMYDYIQDKYPYLNDIFKSMIPHLERYDKYTKMYFYNDERSKVDENCIYKYTEKVIQMLNIQKKVVQTLKKFKKVMKF
jgi:hypothetical protein